MRKLVHGRIGDQPAEIRAALALKINERSLGVLLQIGQRRPPEVVPPPLVEQPLTLVHRHAEPQQPPIAAVRGFVEHA
ncbi:hypothetical protein [Streptomyces sp. NPDC005148]